MVGHGMAVGDAARAYLLLAIGDALVAQIPALMLSIAAAAIVTRVASSHDLAGQIGSQFGSARPWTPGAVILSWKSDGVGKRGSGHVDLGVCAILTKKKTQKQPIK